MLLLRICTPGEAAGHSSWCVPRMPLTETGVGGSTSLFVTLAIIKNYFKVAFGEHCADPGRRAGVPLGVPELSGAVSSAALAGSGPQELSLSPSQPTGTGLTGVLLQKFKRKHSVVKSHT